MATHVRTEPAQWPQPAGSGDVSLLQLRAEKGHANGYASLDGTGKVPASQLPPSGGGSARAADWAMYAVADNGGAFSTYGAQDNQAIYDTVSDTTFITYLGASEDLWVAGIDHSAGRLLTPVKVATATLGIFDSHGVPSIAMDDLGFLHILWGVHGQNPRYARSTAARSIAAWTTPTISVGLGTYHTICFEPTSGHLYALYRAGSNHLADGASAPAAHEYGRLLRSTDRGSTWSEITVANLVSYNADAYKDFYACGCQPYNGRVMFTWTIAHGAGHDGTRSDQFVAFYDPSTNHVYNAAGVDQGTMLDSQAKLFACRAAQRSVVEVAQARIDAVSGEIILAWGEVTGDGKIGTVTALWNGSAWTFGDTGARTKHIKSRPSVGIKPGGGFYVFAITGRDSETIVTDTSTEQIYYVGSGADVSVISTEDAVSFTSHGVIAHRTNFAGQRALALTTPLNAHQDAQALVAAAWPYGAVPARSPVYVLSDAELPGSFYGQVPLKSSSKVYVDFESNAAHALVDITAGAEAPPGSGWRTASGSTKIPENCVSVLLRITAVGAGTSTRARVAFRQKGTTVTAGAVEYTFAANEPTSNIDTRWVPVGPDRQLEWQTNNVTTLQAQVLGFELA